jgi:chromosome condensin MukBEF complex kleisin-like MukF subunit
MNGLTRWAEFIAFLRDRNLHFYLKNSRPGFIMVVVSLPGERYEVEFSEEHAEWAIFTGDETSEDNFDELYARLGGGAR